MWIACDESGFSGTNLLDPSTPIITHAAVDLETVEAAEIVGRVRANARHPRSEYKSTQLLRQRPAVECLLAELAGRASVHLTDKRFFVVQRMVDFLLGEPTYAAGTSLDTDLRKTALALYLREDLGPVLASFVAMMRTKRHRVVNRPAIDRYYEALGRLDDVEELASTRDRAHAVLTKLLDERGEVPPPLEPLLTALVDTTLHWTTSDTTLRHSTSVVDIVHDEQSALTPNRINHIRTLLRKAGEEAGSEVGGLGEFVQVDSREDPRVQAADLLAGVARHLATQELHNQADSELTALLRPFVVRSSLWADEGSGRRLFLGAEV
ncbi:DUF3800 domain-containing protein [Kribbella sp. NPDC006257]|uniref:DUF3800 domain-containing protein n=1 Tax=Kribbella sp. NPDC006257 TaxID=3156738 RepID=UPI0033AFC33F